LSTRKKQDPLANIIHVLPDNIANQIAAGEVIQRPSSAVKELLENAVDAGATSIQLIVSDAGKALIQVIYNGKGMSPSDAAIAFQRHATSKIKAIEDLFAIKTMGFRGEALASIAAVAQVTVKTRRAEDELGTTVDQEVFHLAPGNIKQRIVQILGNTYTSKLVSVTEHTDYMNIYGFIGKPETARKTRGDQYFFVNNRFIKSAYLNHAVNAAYADLIPKDSFPGYVLFIDLDPSQVDINVHPTKQEIKFEDEKIMYAFVGAAVKHALAQFSVAPSLDFSLNADIQGLDAVSKPFTSEKKEATASSSLYQTFTQKHQAHFIERENKGNLGHWKDFYEMPSKGETLAPKKPSLEILADTPLIQIHKTYIIASTNNGFVLVHQQLAHERVVYDKLVIAAQTAQVPTQKSLFPVTLSLGASDSAILSELLTDLQQIGYQVEPFGNNSFVIQGIPADVEPGNEKNAIELLIEQYKHFSSEINFSRREKIIRCMARQQAIKTGQTLAQKEMQVLIESLFACTTPGVTPSGSPTYIEYKEDYLDQLFGK